MLGSEPPFSEESLLSYEFKSNDVAVSVRGRLRKSTRLMTRNTLAVVRMRRQRCSNQGCALLDSTLQIHFVVCI